MLIITEMKVIEVDRDMWELEHMVRKMDMVMPITDEFTPRSAEEASITREMIQGHRFIDGRNNRDIIIGWTQEVQDVLQMPFEAYDYMNKHIETQNIIINDMNKKMKSDFMEHNEVINKASSYIVQLETMTLWEHIKFWYQIHHK